QSLVELAVEERQVGGGGRGSVGQPAEDAGERLAQRPRAGEHARGGGRGPLRLAPPAARLRPGGQSPLPPPPPQAPPAPPARSAASSRCWRGRDPAGPTGGTSSGGSRELSLTAYSTWASSLCILTIFTDLDGNRTPATDEPRREGRSHASTSRYHHLPRAEPPRRMERPGARPAPRPDHSHRNRRAPHGRGGHLRSRDEERGRGGHRRAERGRRPARRPRRGPCLRRRGERREGPGGGR